MAALNKAAFKKTFGARMLRVGSSEKPCFDFWAYVDAVPVEDYAGYDCSEGIVEFVYRSEDGNFEHVLINTREDKDVFMVIVLDVREQSVIGHRLVDMKAEYGLRDTD